MSRRKRVTVTLYEPLLSAVEAEALRTTRSVANYLADSARINVNKYGWNIHHDELERLRARAEAAQANAGRGNG